MSEQSILTFLFKNFHDAQAKRLVVLSLKDHGFKKVM